METYISTVLRGKTLKQAETVFNYKRDIGRRKRLTERLKIFFNFVPKLRHLRARENAKKKRLKSNVRVSVT